MGDHKIDLKIFLIHVRGYGRKKELYFEKYRILYPLPLHFDGQGVIILTNIKISPILRDLRGLHNL